MMAVMKIVFSAVVSATTLSIIVTLHQLSGTAYRRQRIVFTPTGEDPKEKMRPLYTETLTNSTVMEETGAREPERWVYLIALGYSGQQAAGINAFTSFQCWAAHSGQPVKIVEPVIRKSRILSPFYANSEAMKMSDFFDMVHLNNASRLAGLPQIILLKQFLEIGSTDVIFIQFEEESGKDKVIWSAESDTDSCYTAKTSKKQLDRIVRHGYCIRKIVNMISESLTRPKLHEILGSWNHKNVTVVVSNWKGPISPHAECKHMGRQSTKSQFYPSPRLLRDASGYIDSYNSVSVPYSAVMIRLEHAAILAERFPGDYSIKGCLKEVVDIVDSIQGERPVVAADIGNYGSSSWDWAVSNKEKLATGMIDTKRVMQSLLRDQMSFEEWEQTFVHAAGGVTDRGYIAALQRTIASRAKCLVLMGGGNFQDLALLEYLRTHEVERERCVHLVCIHNKGEMRKRIAVSSSQ